MAIFDRLSDITTDKAKKRRQEITAKLKPLRDIEGQVSNIPEYQIPDEVKDYLKMLESTSEEVGKYGERAKDIYGEAVDIAKVQSSMQEVPGANIAREDIKQSTAQQIQNIKESGGSGVGAMGAISNVGMSEQDALRDLAKQTALYKAQATQNLQSALTGQAGFEANLGMDILGQQAQLKGLGYETMIGEKGKQYQSELDKYLTTINFDLMKMQKEKEIIDQVNSGKMKGALGGASTGAQAGSSFGPWGALVGGILGGAVGYGANR